ncbi:MAG: helix-turn-helix domain-containing protein [Clostridia bacterium]|nr:helix-turn-helix domain-containing protein [Clostridia bacterium]
MNDTQKAVIIKLRNENQSYTAIAGTLGVSVSAVKGYCQRNGLAGNRTIGVKQEDPPALPAVCLCCGKSLIQREGIKPVKFCSSSCRQSWWNAHPEKVNRKAIYSFNCTNCGKTFSAYGNKNRKYCSHACYIQDRYDGGEN